MNSSAPPSVHAAPLAGLTVLDLTLALAGPFATFLLAGLGARVIKIENPASPDHCRENAPYIGRHGVSLGRTAPDDVSVAALNRLRGKYAVTLNLKQPGSRAVFADLLRQADVVVENFSAGTLDRLGIGYEYARTQNAAHRVLLDLRLRCRSNDAGLRQSHGQHHPGAERVDDDLGRPGRSARARGRALRRSGGTGIRRGRRSRGTASARHYGRRAAGRRIDARRVDLARRGRALRPARSVRVAAAHRPHGAAAHAFRRLRIGGRLPRDLRANGAVRTRRLRRHRSCRSRARPTLRHARRSRREHGCNERLHREFHARLADGRARAAVRESRSAGGTGALAGRRRARPARARARRNRAHRASGVRARRGRDRSRRADPVFKRRSRAQRGRPPRSVRTMPSSTANGSATARPSSSACARRGTSEAQHEHHRHRRIDRRLRGALPTARPRCRARSRRRRDLVAIGSGRAHPRRGLEGRRCARQHGADARRGCRARAGPLSRAACASSSRPH